MNEHENLRWQNLISLSSPTFAGDGAPPYGFTTRFLARLDAETQQLEMVERIGLRALVASFAMLVVTALFSFGVHQLIQSDFEPGVRSILQVENIQFS